MRLTDRFNMTIDDSFEHPKHMFKLMDKKIFIFLAVFNIIIEPRHEIFNNVVCATSKASDQPLHTYSLIRAFANGLNIL